MLVNEAGGNEDRDVSWDVQESRAISLAATFRTDLEGERSTRRELQ